MLVLAGGTGNPFFTTDTAAVLRAAELDCDAVLKATQVDGVYSADPKTHPDAIRYDRITHEEAISRDLKVMDTAAFALARESLLPIMVGSVHAPSFDRFPALRPFALDACCPLKRGGACATCGANKGETAWHSISTISKGACRERFQASRMILARCGRGEQRPAFLIRFS